MKRSVVAVSVAVFVEAICFDQQLGIIPTRHADPPTWYNSGTSKVHIAQRRLRWQSIRHFECRDLHTDRRLRPLVRQCDILAGHQCRCQCLWRKRARLDYF